MSKKYFNKPESTPLRQALRQNSIKSERLLWNRLRGRQLRWKFRRQHGIGPYIVDFFCPKLKLVIEIDGLSHEGKEAFEYDTKRQKYLERLGITVIRFHTSEVLNRIQETVESIYQVCERLSNDNCQS